MKNRYGNLEPLVVSERGPFPLKPGSLFENTEHPTILEIGFGNGGHLIEKARENPHQNYIGIEMVWGCIRRALKLIHQHQLTNVKLFYDDALMLARHLFEPQSFTEIVALYPCPWPKRRHAKYRLFIQPNLDYLVHLLKPDGTFRIVTDDQPYSKEILEAARYYRQVECQEKTAVLGTKYEKKWQAQGQTLFYHLTIQGQAIQTYPLPKEQPMKHRSLTNFDPLKFQLQDLETLEGDLSVEFKKQLFDPKENLLMIETVASEPGLSQQFWVEISHHQDHWRILPSGASRVIPVLSVNKALEQIEKSLS